MAQNRKGYEKQRTLCIAMGEMIPCGIQIFECIMTGRGVGIMCISLCGGERVYKYCTYRIL
jgi:hypothetical protein